MRLITLLLFISTYAFSQVQPIQIEGNPNKGGFLQANILAEDGTDTLYFYEHVDSTSLADSIYLRGDSLILLKNGSGQVYRARIYDYNQTSVYYYDIPNPQKYDVYVDDQYDSSAKNRYYDGSIWQIFDYDGYIGNEGRLYVLDGTSYNTARIRSYHGDYTDAVLKGDSLVKVNSVFDSNILDITIDTVNLLDLTTQYLNPYVVTGDTVGFYLTVAVDTVLFENTIDTAAYCCPPSLSGDTLYIDDNYVVLPVANIVGGWGIDATESPANTWNLIADTSQVATQYDLSLVSGSQTLSIDSTNRVFEISISGGNTVKFKDTGGIDSTTVVNSYGTTITESPANQWNIKVDSSKFATTYDLSQVSGGASPISLKVTTADYTTSSTTVAEWSGGTNFRDTVDVAGHYKIEVYAQFLSSDLGTGAAFNIYAAGSTNGIGIYEVANSSEAGTSVLRRRSVWTIDSSTAQFLTGTSVSNTAEIHSLYGNVTAYLPANTIVIPKFGSEVAASSVEFQTGARLIITKLF